MKETKKYSIRILMQCGTTQQWITEIIEAEEFWSTERGYYQFKCNEKSKYYPINNTIIEEL